MKTLVDLVICIFILVACYHKAQHSYSGVTALDYNTDQERDNE